MQDAATTPVSTPAPAAEAGVMILTPAAVTQVKAVIKQQGFEGYFFTVKAVQGGCNGLSYDVQLLKDAKPGDFTWEQDGLKLCTDGMSKHYLAGTRVDYVTSDTMSGFKFENPNAKSSCGCGSSFST